MSSGIYCIKNDINDKVYVGKARNLENRWEQHKTKLIKNIHNNTYLQQDFNKFGMDAFTFSVLEVVEEQANIDRVLFAKEREWGEKLKARDREYGYNIANFQQEKENNYEDAKSICHHGMTWTSPQRDFTYIAYHLPFECYALYIHINVNVRTYGTSGVKEEDDGMSVISVSELALLSNITEGKVKKLIMEMKKHGLIKPYINKRNSSEYGFRFYESDRCKEQVERKWEEL